MSGGTHACRVYARVACVCACVCVRMCVRVRVCVRACIGAGEGTPYNIEMAACVSGSDCECVREPFGNGVTLFSNPNRQ